MATVATEVIKPQKAKNLRFVFLFTGQGDSTVAAIPTGEGVDDYEFILIDADLDKEENEVNLVALFKDLLDGKKLPKYINTHPHKDHTGGIKEFYDKIGIEEVWHSNHRPKGDHKDSFEELKYVLDKVGKENEFHLKGTNSLNKLRKHDDTEIDKSIGLIDFQVFSPAEYVCDDIDEETSDVQYERIHEQCGVIKFSYQDKAVLFKGDAEKCAWKEHIVDYYKEQLKADVTTGSHHGSRTSFKKNEDDTDVYKKHLDYIDAEYLIISAPKQKDSPHGHPHDDAMDIYKEYFEEDKIFHLGEGPFCVVVTIDESGNLTVEKDERLIETYGKDNVDNNEKKDEEKKKKEDRAKVLTGLAAAAKPWGK